MEKTIEGIKLRVVPAVEDVYRDMAETMLRQVQENNRKNRHTVLIVPVGPTEQYPIFAQLVTEARLSLKNVYTFNMDEYLETPARRIPDDHPMSFHGRMKRELWDLLPQELTVPQDQRFFPEPGREAEYGKRIAALGGADLCLGGLGINGHIAFNEPPEPESMIPADSFARLPTRVLPISRETRTVNAIGYQRGDIRGMPEWCVTVGMDSILASKKIYIALNRDWQHGIARHVLYDEITAAIPATLLKRHGQVEFVTCESIAKGL